MDFSPDMLDACKLAMADVPTDGSYHCGSILDMPFGDNMCVAPLRPYAPPAVLRTHLLPAAALARNVTLVPPRARSSIRFDAVLMCVAPLRPYAPPAVLRTHLLPAAALARNVTPCSAPAPVQQSGGPAHRGR